MDNSIFNSWNSHCSWTKEFLSVERLNHGSKWQIQLQIANYGLRSGIKNTASAQIHGFARADFRIGVLRSKKSLAKTERSKEITL